MKLIYNKHILLSYILEIKIYIFSMIMKLIYNKHILLRYILEITIYIYIFPWLWNRFIKKKTYCYILF